MGTRLCLALSLLPCTHSPRFADCNSPKDFCEIDLIAGSVSPELNPFLSLARHLRQLQLLWKSGVVAVVALPVMRCCSVIGPRIPCLFTNMTNCADLATSTCQYLARCSASAITTHYVCAEGCANFTLHWVASSSYCVGGS